MTFLKKLGLIIAKVGVAALGFGDLLKQYVPGTSGVVNVFEDTFLKVAAIVVSVEAAAASLTDVTLTGAQKLAMATTQVADAIINSALVAGKKIALPELFKQGCAKIASGVCDVLNSLHPDSVKEIKSEDIKLPLAA